MSKPCKQARTRSIPNRASKLVPLVLLAVFGIASLNGCSDRRVLPDLYRDAQACSGANDPTSCAAAEATARAAFEQAAPRFPDAARCSILADDCGQDGDGTFAPMMAGFIFTRDKAGRYAGTGAYFGVPEGCDPLKAPASDACRRRRGGAGQVRYVLSATGEYLGWVDPAATPPLAAMRLRTGAPPRGKPSASQSGQAQASGASSARAVSVPEFPGSRVFSSMPACEDQYGAQMCSHAWSYARQHFVQDAPRFAQRLQCETQFGVCEAVGDQGFLPAMQGLFVSKAPGAPVGEFRAVGIHQGAPPWCEISSRQPDCMAWYQAAMAGAARNLHFFSVSGRYMGASAASDTSSGVYSVFDPTIRPGHP